jgi:uncharacterized damage-inducible protein DinB
MPDFDSGTQDSKAVISVLHASLHDSLGVVFEHLASVPAELWTKEIDGFGRPTLRDQILHILACEAGWVRGLQLRPYQRLDPAAFGTVDAFRALQRDVISATTTYLQSLDEQRLFAKLERYPERWFGPQRTPGFILLHVITHGFHHKGQAVAMLRLLGHPAPDTDIQRE